MRKLLTSKYEGVYVYQIILAFLFLVLVGILMIFSIDNIIEKDMYAVNNEYTLDRSGIDIVSTDLNNISRESWNDKYKGISLRDNYRNNYIKKVSNITSNLELGNVVYEYTGSIGDNYYNIRLNDNRWFLFNKFDSNMNKSFYIVDNNMNFYQVSLNITSMINTYSNLDIVKLYTHDNFYYYHNPINGDLYGYKYMFKANNISYYLTINVKGIKLTDNRVNKLIVNLSNNIKISILDKLDYKGFKIPNNKEYISINDDFMFNFKDYVSIKNWYNNLENNSIVIELINNNSNTKYTIEETIIDNIDHIVKKKGILLYNYFGTDIYLRYDYKKYKKFNTTEGGINGVILFVDNRMFNISFNNSSFSSQLELNNILSDMSSFLITHS